MIDGKGEISMEKTNVMRALEQAKTAYTAHYYEAGDAVDGVSVAHKIGFDPARVFKTLVTRGPKEILVFVVPSDRELHLKAAAKAAGVKAIEMIHVSEITALTGYVRGGCSPVGMKKRYRTFIDQSAQGCESVIVSAGKLGAQVELLPEDLRRQTGAAFVRLTEDR